MVTALSDFLRTGFGPSNAALTGVVNGFLGTPENLVKGPHDLFLVGDAHQRIYGRVRVVLSRCGIGVVGRSRKLRLNYRTTEETRGRAAGLLHGRPVDDLDGGKDDDRIRSLTHGPAPLS